MQKINDKFSVIGSHFINASKGHYQTNLKFKIKEIHNVWINYVFNKKIFNKNKGFIIIFFCTGKKLTITNEQAKMVIKPINLI